jgi:hypothetical protein
MFDPQASAKQGLPIQILRIKLTLTAVKKSTCAANFTTIIYNFNIRILNMYRQRSGSEQYHAPEVENKRQKNNPWTLG